MVGEIGMTKKTFSSSNRYQRRQPHLALKPRFVIAMEGDSTELDYFRNLRRFCPGITVDSIKSNHHSSPKNVLKRIKEKLKSHPLESDDQAWIVIDRDQWPQDQLVELKKWVNNTKNVHIALSNPKFEFWLLLHFEDAKGVQTPKACDERLKRYLTDYDKSLNDRDFPLDLIKRAIKRAEKIVINPQDWPNQPGTTAVYELVSEMLRWGNNEN